MSSDLYWGKYASKDAAKADMERARNWRNSRNVQVYLKTAEVVPIPGVDIGPPEFNLKNAGGVYTVLIATFYDAPESCECAVEYCKVLRAGGEEAYFYHTDVQSIVTIGTFDASAIKEVREANGATSTYINSDKINAILQKHPLLAENGRSMKIKVADVITHVPKWIDKHSYVIKIPRSDEVPLPTLPEGSTVLPPG